MQFETHELAPENTSQPAKQLTADIDSHAFPLVFVFFLETVRQSHHWVEISPTEWRGQANRHQDSSCCLSVDLIGYHGAAERESEDKHGYELESEELKSGSIVHDAVHRVVEVTVDAGLECLRYLQLLF